MKININETMKHAVEKNTQCDPFFNGMGLKTWDFVSDRANLKDDELLSEKHFKVLDEMIKEEGVYIDLIPNDGMVFKIISNDLYVYQELEVDGEIITNGPVVYDYYEGVKLMEDLLDLEEGHYGIALFENDGEISIEYGKIGPASPAGHCPPEFEDYNEDSDIAKLLKNSIVFDKD